MVGMTYLFDQKRQMWVFYLRNDVIILVCILFTFGATMKENNL